MPFKFIKFMGVLSLAGLCSLAALQKAPWDRIPWSAVHDAKTHTELVAAAAEAQREGQWLLREAPRVARMQDPVFFRYPVFQFYSVFPYALAGLLVNGGLGSYHALLAVVFLSFVAGFLGIYYLVLQEGGTWDAAIAAAAAFSFAPYHLTDWYGRFAFPEVVAFGLLPFVLWRSLKASRSERLADILWAAAAWVPLILSHNIFHLYALVFIAGLSIWLAWTTKKEGALWRPAAAYVLGALSCAWYLVPLALCGSKLLMAYQTAAPIQHAALAPLGVLLSPVFLAADTVRDTAPYLGLQIGWILLAGALLSFFPQDRRRGGGLGRAYLALFLLALFMAWSPLDFWPWVGALRIVQFPYRVLVFATLFGALLVAEAWGLYAGAFPRLGQRLGALLLLLLLAGALGAPYRLAKGTDWPADVPDKFYGEMGLNLRTGYVYVYPSFRPQKPLKDARAALYIDTEKIPKTSIKMSFKTGLVTRVLLEDLQEQSSVLLPAPWYPDLYQIWVNGQPQAGIPSSARSSNRLAVKVPAGRVSIDYRFGGLPWANALSSAAGALFALLALSCAWDVKGRTRPGGGDVPAP